MIFLMCITLIGVITFIPDLYEIAVRWTAKRRAYRRLRLLGAERHWVTAQLKLLVELAEERSPNAEAFAWALDRSVSDVVRAGRA